VLLKVINPVVCGLDVHKDSVKACLLKAKDAETYTDALRTFTTMTSDLENLKQWLLDSNCRKVVMESTGKHWIPIHNVLEGAFEITLANARYVKNLPGRKTDANDARWLAKLLGTAMLEALTAEDEQETLDNDAIANLAKRRLRQKIPQLIEALNGHLNKHQKDLIHEIQKHLAFLDTQLERLEAMIDEMCEPYQELIDLMITHPGVNKTAAQAILAEIGTDMEVFHSAEQLASWCGLTPANNESAGIKKTTRVRAGNNHAKTILCQCAHAAANTKKTYISFRYWSLKARRGAQKASIATARKITTAFFYMIRDRVPYQEAGPDFYREARDRNKAQSMIKKLNKLGYHVTEQEKTA